MIVTEFALIDLPLQNTHFTWSNFRSNAACIKIDRVFFSCPRLEKFPAAALKGLPRPISDRYPLLDTDRMKDGPSPFRYENMWMQHKSFKIVVKSMCDQAPQGTWAGIRLQHKLKYLKNRLKE